ncbi:transposase [Rhodococcus sp. G-MC3]|uniref:transposase n=1 Tax=Rhodococcus sp. G-MC3 TaxID=3046209 RepID=UPI0024BB8DCC|nr:transposase [Rhodococcus sp. G-MC3]MDJ0396784.1 transposase [Rhodococcus sp. G-MC3]
MARDYRPSNLDQGFLIPPDIRDWLDNDHVAWLVIEAVAAMDTSAFHRRRPGRRTKTSMAGRAGYDPDQLLALLIYAYAVGERSSRRIEKLCWTDVAFRVLCGNDIPDHTVIARFRAEHDKAFENLFTEVLVLCKANGMGRFGELALDGTKIAANAAKDATRSEQTLRKMARESIDDAYRTDKADTDAIRRGRDDSLPPSLRSGEVRTKTIAAAVEKLEANKAADIDARRAADPNGKDEITTADERVTAAEGKYEQAVTVHRASVDRWQSRVDAGVRPGRKPKSAQDTSRVKYAACRLERARDTALAVRTPKSEGGRGKNYRINLTDPDSALMKTRGGFVQGFNAQLMVSSDYLIVACHASADGTDMQSYVPMVAAAEAVLESVWGADGKKKIGTVLADAGYCSVANLTAEGPHRLIATDSRRHRARTEPENANTDTSEHKSPEVAAMREYLTTEDGHARYIRRGALVEPVNAHLKDRRGLRQFARRGLGAVNAELTLAAAVTNLQRLFTTKNITRGALLA